MKKLFLMFIIISLIECNRQTTIDQKNSSPEESIKNEGQFNDEYGHISFEYSYASNVDIFSFYIAIFKHKEDRLEFKKFYEDIKIDMKVNDIDVDARNYLYECERDSVCTSGGVKCICIANQNRLSSKDKVKITLTKIGDRYLIYSYNKPYPIKKYSVYLNYEKVPVIFRVTVSYYENGGYNRIVTQFSQNVELFDWENIEIYLDDGSIIRIIDKNNIEEGSCCIFRYYGDEIDYKKIKKVRINGEINYRDLEQNNTEIIKNPEIEITNDLWIYSARYINPKDNSTVTIIEWSKCIDELEIEK